MFGFSYSYCKVNYSKTASTNNFEDFLPDVSRLAPCETKADLLDSGKTYQVTGDYALQVTI